MINPQMMGMTPGQLPDLPTQAQLWKDEKSKYRPFMIMFAIGILAVFALLLTSFIVNVTAPDLKGTITDTLMDKHKDYYNSNKFTNPRLEASEDADNWYTKFVMAFPIVSFIVLGIGVILYFASLYNSYVSKTFAKLSGFATLAVFMGAAFSVFQLIQMAFPDTGANIMIDFPGGIFQVVAYSLVIALAILGSQVSKIKRIFMMSARVETLKNDPAYQAAMAQMQAMQNGQMPQGTMGPFGPIAPGTAAGVATPGVNPVGPQVPVMSKEQEKLEKMSLADLKKVAVKLSISGADKMEKKELISAILRVTDNK